MVLLRAKNPPIPVPLARDFLEARKISPPIPALSSARFFRANFAKKEGRAQRKARPFCFLFYAEN